MLITDDPAAFRGAMAPGDVATFDSTGFNAGLVQWADRVPVNHAALVLDGATFLEANRVHEGEGPPHAVREVDVAERLGNPVVQTVTLLRHAEATVDDAQAVLHEARGYLSRRTDFAYLQLVALGPLALRRSYPTEPGGSAFAELAGWLVGRLGEAAQRLSASGAWSLSCSEFVYRCYAAAELSLPVISPLEAMPGSRTAELWEALQQHNSAAGPGDKYAALSGGVDADRITPGDLHRCGLLTPVAVLHRPPGRGGEPADDGLELG